MYSISVFICILDAVEYFSAVKAMHMTVKATSESHGSWIAPWVFDAWACLYSSKPVTCLSNFDKKNSKNHVKFARIKSACGGWFQKHSFSQPSDLQTSFHQLEFSLDDRSYYTLEVTWELGSFSLQQVESLDCLHQPAIAASNIYFSLFVLPCSIFVCCHYITCSTTMSLHFNEWQ
jgi:hypothetical protein